MPPPSAPSAPLQQGRNRDSLVFGIAALHTFLLTFPGLVSSLAGLPDVTLHWFLSPVVVRQLCNNDNVDNPVPKFLFQLVLWIILCWSALYYYLYQQSAQPPAFLVALSGVAKLGAAALIWQWYAAGLVRVSYVCVAIVPDFSLGFYFLYLSAGLYGIHRRRCLSFSTAHDDKIKTT